MNQTLAAAVATLNADHEAATPEAVDVNGLYATLEALDAAVRPLLEAVEALVEPRGAAWLDDDSYDDGTWRVYHDNGLVYRVDEAGVIRTED